MTPRIQVPSSCIQTAIAIRAGYGGPNPDNTRLSIAVPLWLGPRPVAFAYTIDTGPGP